MYYPTPRSTEDETEGTGPCGGFPVSDQRTSVSMTSFPVALMMGHDRTVVQMLLALGNNPGDNFNITLEQTFQQQGEGDFCLPDVLVPTGLDIADGTNGTLQVVTDGEGGGGLYIVSDSCAHTTRETLLTLISVPISCSLQLKPHNRHPARTGLVSLQCHFLETLTQTSPTRKVTHKKAAQLLLSQAPSSPTDSASGSSSSSSNQAIMFTAGWGVLGGAVIGAIALM